MSEKVIYLKGKVKGFFRQGDTQITGVYSFSERILYAADVLNADVISEFDIDENCVGHYFRSTRHHTLRFFINEAEYVSERVKHFVIRDIVIYDKTILDSELLVPFEGVILLKLTKSIPPPATTHTKTTSLFGLTGLTVTSGAQGIGCFGRPLQLLTAPFNRPGDTVTSSSGSVGREFLSILIGSIILSLIIGFALRFFGVSPQLSMVIPLLFFLSMLLHGLFKPFPRLQDHLGIQRPILNFFAWALILGNLYSIIKHGAHFSNIHGLLLGLALFLLSRTGKIVRIIGILLLGAQLLFYFTQVRDALKKEPKKDESEYVEPEDNELIKTELDSTNIKTKDNDTIELKYRMHRHNWKDNARNYFNGVFKVRDDHYNISRIKRNQLEVSAQTSLDYWRQIYRRLSSEKAEYLEDVVKEYKRIIKMRNLNEYQAADMIVTSVQNIPYCLVHDLSHEEADLQYGGFISEWHQTGGPCLDLIKFGLQSPTEFMGNFKGDCDTRSVMLYYVLSELGYNVAVLASDRYGHAILGISGNLRGKYIKYRGLNFYVWETTYPGYTPGVLSDECGDMRYWYVALGPKT